MPEKETSTRAVPTFAEVLNHKLRGSPLVSLCNDLGKAYRTEETSEAVDAILEEIRREAALIPCEMLSSRDCDFFLSNILNFFASSNPSSLKVAHVFLDLLESANRPPEGDRIIGVRQRYALAKRAFPMKFERLYAQAIEASTSPRHEVILIKTLSEFFPGIEVCGSIIDGFQCDILLPGHRLNVEIDGKHHEQQKKKDENRDLYLEKKHHIKTIRIRPKYRARDNTMSPQFTKKLLDSVQDHVDPKKKNTEADYAAFAKYYESHLD